MFKTEAQPLLGTHLSKIKSFFLLIDFQSHDEIDTVVLAEVVFYGFWAINVVLIACELGQRISNSFETIENRINLLAWYSLPIEVQRILPIIMINAQQPAIVAFFGSIACSRLQFKKVKIK